MTLNLNRPIAFFDLETTGLKITQDRIVEISILKIFPDGSKKSKTWLVNPGIDIPEEVIEIHGITNEKVKDKASFKEIAHEIIDLIDGCDLGGYNSNRFDLPLLQEEFIRANIDFDVKKHKSIDVQNIFHKLEQRTLAGAYKFYCDKNLDNAHSAEADTKATYEVLLAQLEKYEELKNDIDYLSEFSEIGGKFIDMAGFVRYNDKKERVFSFGKNKGKTLEEVWNSNPGYFSWIQQADFPLYTKNLLKNFTNQMKLKKKFGSE